MSTRNSPPQELTSHGRQARPGCVVYVAPDCTDSAVRKRARGFIGSGFDVVSFSFRRNRYNVGFVPDWPNIELGRTTEQRLLTRVFMFVRALGVIYGHRRTWRTASLLYARNLDLALLALIGKVVTRCAAPFAYEVLDVHPALTRPGVFGAVLRWLERRVLAHCKLLVVSSPAFLRQYFHPTQRYEGATYVLENKWPRSEMLGLDRKLRDPLAEPEPKWTIGWFGNIRCPRSLEILTELADALPERVEIYIRGYASLLGERKLLDVIRRRDNMIFQGEYCAPEDFPAIYSKIHFNWCVDLDGGDNSLWLLPNRLYEGGYFGIPALAIASHETGRVVRERHWGISLETPVTEHLRNLFLKMRREDYLQLRRSMESLPVSHFVDDGDISRLMAMVEIQKNSGNGSRSGEHPRSADGALLER